MGVKADGVGLYLLLWQIADTQATNRKFGDGFLKKLAISDHSISNFCAVSSLTVSSIRCMFRKQSTYEHLNTVKNDYSIILGPCYGFYVFAERHSSRLTVRLLSANQLPYFCWKLSSEIVKSSGTLLESPIWMEISSPYQR